MAYTLTGVRGNDDDDDEVIAIFNSVWRLRGKRASTAVVSKKKDREDTSQ